LNSSQRLAVIVGVLAMLASLLYAPFHYLGSTSLVTFEPVSGTTFAFFFDAPKAGDFVYADDKAISVYKSELDVGKVAIVWGGHCCSVGSTLALLFSSVTAIAFGILASVIASYFYAFLTSQPDAHPVTRQASICAGKG
jgi:hypothetical protein